MQATALSDTEDASNPFFSPDGQWIGFFASGALKKVSVTGGAAVSLCELPPSATEVRGAWWSEDGTIIFQPNPYSPSLQRISSNGGTPVSLSTPGEGEVTERWPQVLPGGKALLYTAHTSMTNFDSANLVVQPLPTGPPKVVVRGGYHGRYVPSGHLIYMRDGTLFAVPFDLTRLQAAGPAAPALKGVTSSPLNAGAQFAFSATGTLVYLPGAAALGNSKGPVDWMVQAGAGGHHQQRCAHQGGNGVQPAAEHAGYLAD